MHYLEQVLGVVEFVIVLYQLNVHLKPFKQLWLALNVFTDLIPKPNVHKLFFHKDEINQYQ